MAKKKTPSEYTKQELALVRKTQDAITKIDAPKVMQLIAKRKENLIEKSQEYCDEHGIDELTTSIIMYHLTEGNSYLNVQYTPYDLQVLLEWYREITIQIQEKVFRHRPSKLQFCQIIGISSRTYDQLLKSDDPAMVEVMTRIEDYIKEEIYARVHSGMLQRNIAQHELEATHQHVVTKKSENVIKEEYTDVEGAMKKLDLIKKFSKDNAIEAEYQEIDNEGAKE